MRPAEKTSLAPTSIASGHSRAPLQTIMDFIASHSRISPPSKLCRRPNGKPELTKFYRRSNTERDINQYRSSRSRDGYYWEDNCLDWQISGVGFGLHRHQLTKSRASGSISQYAFPPKNITSLFFCVCHFLLLIFFEQPADV